MFLKLIEAEKCNWIKQINYFVANFIAAISTWFIYLTKKQKKASKWKWLNFFLLKTSTALSIDLKATRRLSNCAFSSWKQLRGIWRFFVAWNRCQWRVKTEIYDDFLTIIEKMKGVGENAKKMSLLMRHQNRWDYKVNLTCQLYHNFFNLKEFCRLRIPNSLIGNLPRWAVHSLHIIIASHSAYSNSLWKQVGYKMLN